MTTKFQAPFPLFFASAMFSPYCLCTTTKLAVSFLQRLRAPLFEKLWLSNNDLAGPISAIIGQCSHLKDLELSNIINDTFPASFGDCTKLERIMVANNLLSRELESVKFEQLRSLEVLSLANNSLIGPIPESLRPMFEWPLNNDICRLIDRCTICWNKY